jgi:hypothetical protein
MLGTLRIVVLRECGEETKGHTLLPDRRTVPEIRIGHHTMSSLYMWTEALLREAIQRKEEYPFDLNCRPSLRLLGRELLELQCRVDKDHNPSEHDWIFDDYITRHLLRRVFKRTNMDASELTHALREPYPLDHPTSSFQRDFRVECQAITKDSALFKDALLTFLAYDVGHVDPMWWNPYRIQKRKA